MELSDLINEFGNIQKTDIVGKTEFVHVNGDRLQPLCRHAGIEFAPCVIGFKKSGGRYNPIKDGVIIYALDLDKLQIQIKSREKRNTSEIKEKRKIARENRSQKKQIQFAVKIRNSFPSTPAGEEFEIAERACQVGSGRVGRSNTANDPITAAVKAHIRHKYTDYDVLRENLESIGFDSDYAWADARDSVAREIKKILREWQKPVAADSNF